MPSTKSREEREQELREMMKTPKGMGQLLELYMKAKKIPFGETIPVGPGGSQMVVEILQLEYGK